MHLSINNFFILLGSEKDLIQQFIQQIINNGIDQSAIVSSEIIKKNILGSYISPDGDKIYGNEIVKEQFNNILKSIIDLRVHQKLPVVLDNNLQNPTQLKIWVDYAKKYHYEPIIIDCSNTLKEHPYPFIHYKGEELTILPNLINTTKLDVVGDTHGLLNEFLIMMKSCGWNYDVQQHLLIHIDPERKILFLGDCVDRGVDSLPLLKLVKNMCQKGSAYFVIGNHEDKLLQNYNHFKTFNTVKRKSLSSSLTFMDFLKLPHHEKESIDNFLKSSPHNFNLWIDKKNSSSTENKSNNDVEKFAFFHANNIHYDEYNMPRNYSLYGPMEKYEDSDKIYQEGFDKGIFKHTVFHGHTEQTSSQKNILSLEEGQCFEGFLYVLHFDKYLELLKNNNWEYNISFFEESSTKLKTEFNFNNYIRKNMTILKEMENLVKEGLATDGWKKDNNNQKIPHPDGFKVYKYSKSVHFKRLWKTNPWIEKARGIVLDSAGNIVVHPFDKLYNFGEYNAGNHLPLSTPVQKIEKMNGYLACISKHPFKNELFPTTQGSMSADAPFVKMINDHITPEMTATLLKYFDNNKVTLMFENIHKDDPHIIPYEESSYGLWLIGARDLSLEAPIKSEAELDVIAKELGFRRPKWEVDTLENVIKDMETSETEGCMVRLTDNTPIMKIKTDYYLVTKFIGRIGSNMTEMMYTNPEKFKETKLEEEFYPIVDKLIASTSKEDFINMDRIKRVELVRVIVDDIRKSSVDELVNGQNNTNKPKI